MSANDADTNGLKEKLGAKQGESTLGLTAEEVMAANQFGLGNFNGTVYLDGCFACTWWRAIGFNSQ